MARGGEGERQGGVSNPRARSKYERGSYWAEPPSTRGEGKTFPVSQTETIERPSEMNLWESVLRTPKRVSECPCAREGESVVWQFHLLTVRNHARFQLYDVTMFVNTCR